MSSRALAQRRHRERDDGEAVEQIEPKAAAVDLGAKIAMSRRDDADVDGDLGAATEPSHPAALEHAEQRRLHRGLELADLVEEHGAAVRGFERADVRRSAPVNAPRS